METETFALIVGGGGHGLGAAYYLASEHRLTNIAVYGYFTAEAALLIGLPRSGYTFLLNDANAFEIDYVHVLGLRAAKSVNPVWGAKRLNDFTPEKDSSSHALCRSCTTSPPSER